MQGEPRRRHRHRTAATPTSSTPIGIASLAFSDIATVSGTARFSAWTDKFCPTGDPGLERRHAREVLHGPELGASDPNRLFDKDPNTNRFGGSRLYFGFAATAAIDRFTSVFLQIEFLPFPDQLSIKARSAFTDTYNGALFVEGSVRLRHGRLHPEVLSGSAVRSTGPR